MTADDRPTQTHRLAVKDLVDELLIYDSENDRVHILNTTARSIYLSCDGTRSVDDLVRNVVSEFDIDRATAAEDALVVLKQLVELGVVRVNGSDPSSD